MKAIKYSLIITAFLMQSIFSLQAQTTEGKEFWVTFGRNWTATIPKNVDLQIRIVAKDEHTTGKIYFTHLDTYVDFEIEARQVYTYVLDSTEKCAVYNVTTGATNYSVHITSNAPIAVYALNQHVQFCDATNVLPVTALNTEYYLISYANIPSDAFAVIATEDNTEVYHNNVPLATIDKGDVYYKGPHFPDMTGDFISSNKPIALFALNRNFAILGGSENMFQQMAPVNTWGKNFFVPVSHILLDIVRIVASQNNTNIIQRGGEIRTVPGAQTTLDNLQAGQFVELGVPVDSNGCFIKADQPVGICTFLSGDNSMGFYGDAAPAWLPSIEQSVKSALVAPFIPSGATNIHSHFATIFTPTATRENTKVSIGGASPTDLSGGIWIDHDEAEMSFYKMPLTNDTAAYYFTNPAGLIILCYGVGWGESYYYLAYSGMRDLSAAFYANDIHYIDLLSQTICIKDVIFRAEIEGFNPVQDSVRWYIDDGNGEIEEMDARDLLEWSKSFSNGEYEIRMEVLIENEEPINRTGTLKIQALWIKMRNVRY
jgi:hypothetical protein